MHGITSHQRKRKGGEGEQAYNHLPITVKSILTTECYFKRLKMCFRKHLHRKLLCLSFSICLKVFLLSLSRGLSIDVVDLNFKKFPFIILKFQLLFHIINMILSIEQTSKNSLISLAAYKIN